MVRLYRSTLINGDGSFVTDAITRREPAYDRLRRATAGCWFAASPELDRYSRYRAAVITERRMRGSAASIAASANRDVVRALLTAVECLRTAAAQLDRAAASMAVIAATGFPALWSIDRIRRLLAEVRDGSVGSGIARARISYLGRRSGSLARWYQPVSEVDVLALTEPASERVALVVADLRRAWDGEAVAASHGLPAALMTPLTRAVNPLAPDWRERTLERLPPIIAEAVPPPSVHPALLVLRLEADIADSVASVSRLAGLPDPLRELAPQADQEAEYLLPPEFARQARVAGAYLLHRGRDDCLPGGSYPPPPRRPGLTASQRDAAVHPFAGWRDHRADNTLRVQSAVAAV